MPFVPQVVAAPKTVFGIEKKDTPVIKTIIISQPHFKTLFCIKVQSTKFKKLKMSHYLKQFPSSLAKLHHVKAHR